MKMRKILFLGALSTAVIAIVPIAMVSCGKLDEGDKLKIKAEGIKNPTLRKMIKDSIDTSFKQFKDYNNASKEDKDKINKNLDTVFGPLISFLKTLINQVDPDSKLDANKVNTMKEYNNFFVDTYNKLIDNIIKNQK